MSKIRWAFRNLRTGEVVPAQSGPYVGSPPITERPPGATVLVEHPGAVVMVLPDGARTPLRPHVPYRVTAGDWMFGVVTPDEVFHPSGKSVSYIVEFPAETTAELDELVKDVGGDATELFKRAISLYKLARDAVHEGKAVGAASSPDAFDIQFTGI